MGYTARTMLNIPLVVTPFLLVIVVILGLVAENWLRERAASRQRLTVLALVGVAVLWGLVVMINGAYVAYMSSPPDVPSLRSY